MKKLLTLAMAAALALALAGCVTTVKEEKAPTMSASDESAPSSASSSSSSQQVNWIEADTAADAAKGAGIGTFGVMDEIDLDDMRLADPSFAYAGGVAQAVYETPATQLTVRKADGTHTAPLTDRDKTEFAQTWTKGYEGLDVTCYGAAHGAATVFTWADGTQEYGVTWQGLGGDEMSMDSDEVAAIMKGFQAANAGQAGSSSVSDGTDNDLTEAQVQDILFQNGLGGFVSAQLVQGSDGVWYWQAVTTDTANRQHTWLVDPSGNVTNADGEESQTTLYGILAEADIRNIASQQGLGEFVSAVPYQSNDDGLWYWNLTTRDAQGANHYYIVDPHGNVSEAGA